MKKNSLLISEIFGFFVIFFTAVFLWNIYELSGKATPAVIFGAVNGSVWEKAKCLSISYALYAIIQIFCVKPSFKQFVAAKVISLCTALTMFIVTDYCLDYDLPILGVAVLSGLLCSYLLMCSSLNLRSLFAPMCFLLLLIFMMTFTFTAFTPKLGIFCDPYTGYYGVIPPSFDMGAVSLGS